MNYRVFITSKIAVSGYLLKFCCTFNDSRLRIFEIKASDHDLNCFCVLRENV